MKIVYTRHALEKIRFLRKEGWRVSKQKIESVIKKPGWVGVTKEGQSTVMELMDDKHVIRIVLDKKDGIIKVVTFHITRRGRYESTL